MYVHTYVHKKAAEKTFVQKICTFNVDEIDPWKRSNPKRFKCKKVECNSNTVKINPTYLPLAN